MKKLIKNILFYLQTIRFIPHLVIYYFNSKYSFLKEERNIWINIIKNESVYSLKNHLWLFLNLPEYRSVFYFRLGWISKLFSWLAKGQVCLSLASQKSDKAGVGMVFQHGHSTRVGAASIGKNCQIWHNVTIGANKSHTSDSRPFIGNNVKVSTGAIIMGNIKVGNNVTIGAGAVVTKNVPDNCVVVGNPAYIIRLNGQPVRKTL